MKHKLFSLVLIVALLTGCASSSLKSESVSAPSMDATGDMSFEMDMEMAPGAPMEDSGAQLEQKFIYTGTLSLETTSFETAIADIATLVDTMGGYIERSSVENQGRYRYGDYTVRIPADALDAFTAKAGEVCLVVYSATDLQDISFEYYDTKGRLETQQIKMERLQSLLAQAETMEDLLTIEDSISQTQWEIDNYSGTIKHFDAQVEYATVDVSVREVTQLSNVEPTPIGFGGRLSSAFTGGIESFIDGMEDLAVFVAYNWLSMLVWVAVITGICKFVRKKGPKFKRKPNTPE